MKIAMGGDGQKVFDLESEGYQKSQNRCSMRGASLLPEPQNNRRHTEIWKYPALQKNLVVYAVCFFTFFPKNKLLYFKAHFFINNF